MVERVLVRAFDKAVRRKPLAFAADAVGLWAMHVGEGGTRMARERWGSWLIGPLADVAGYLH